MGCLPQPRCCLGDHPPRAAASLGVWSMLSSSPQTDLLGRRSECERLSSLVAAAKAGRSQVLVLRGEPGIGKSALLGYLRGLAVGCRVGSAAGVESEMELPFASLHQDRKSTRLNSSHANI